VDQYKLLAMGWSDKTEAWRQRVIWLRRSDGGGGEHLLPDLSDAALEAGAYTRPHFSSTWAVSDTKYTLNTH